MCNGAAERRRLRALGIDMDELVIVSGVCKQVDALLLHLLPVRVAQMDSSQARTTGNGHAISVDCAHASPPRSVLSTALL
jgi:hypothetical protein